MVLEDGAQGERKEGLPFIRTTVQVCGLGLRAGEEGVRCAKQDHTGLCTHASQLMKYLSQLEVWLGWTVGPKRAAGPEAESGCAQQLGMPAVGRGAGVEPNETVNHRRPARTSRPPCVF